jgi:hypothetical protein
MTEIIEYVSRKLDESEVVSATLAAYIAAGRAAKLSAHAAQSGAANEIRPMLIHLLIQAYLNDDIHLLQKFWGSFAELLSYYHNASYNNNLGKDLGLKDTFQASPTILYLLDQLSAAVPSQQLWEKLTPAERADLDALKQEALERSKHPASHLAPMEILDSHLKKQLQSLLA